MKLHKSYQAEVKVAPGDEGTVEMYVSMFGNVDLVGDRVVKGAFAKSLENFKNNGDPIPFIWNHQWEDPDAHIGKVLDAQETDEGLFVKAQLDMDEPKAAKVFRLLKERRVKEASFAYDVVREKKASDGANELIELDLIEVGPTVKGANPETRLVTAKNEPVSDEMLAEVSEIRDQVDVKLALAALKAGRVLSAKNESSLRQASDLLQQVLSQITSEGDVAKAVAKAKAEESQTRSQLPEHGDRLQSLVLELMASAIEGDPS